MKFYVGVSSTSHIKYVPYRFLFSVSRLLDRKSKINTFGKEWILDSGGFTQLLLNGKYTFTIEDYIEIVKLQEPNIFVSMDWMCEPWILKKTCKTIKDHLTFTVNNHIKIKELYNGSSKLMGVVQGYNKDDYLTHVDMLKEHGLIEEYMGIGTLCRRQSTDDILNIPFLIKRNLPEWVKLHGFGVKTLALKKCGIYNLLYSSDSESWSFLARKLQKRVVNEIGICKCDNSICKSKAKNCANCGRYMRYWTLKIEELINKNERYRMKLDDFVDKVDTSATSQ